MNVQANLFYKESHEWVEFLEDGRARVGISDHAQEAMGDVAFINLCDDGEVLQAGDVLGDIESIKAVSDIYCPVDGTVESVNEALLEAPEGLNADPYGSWLITLCDVTKNDDLMDAAQYEAFLASQE